MKPTAAKINPAMTAILMRRAESLRLRSMVSTVDGLAIARYPPCALTSKCVANGVDEETVNAL
jgi:hypothetical protein